MSIKHGGMEHVCGPNYSEGWGKSNAQAQEFRGNLDVTQKLNIKNKVFCFCIVYTTMSDI